VTNPARAMSWKRVVALTLCAVAVIYSAAILLVQRLLLFPAPEVRTSVHRPVDALQVWLPTSSGQAEAWYLAPLAGDTRPAPVMVFFHGNGELIDLVAHDFQTPRSWGVGVLLVEYPGYGRSAGSPSQATVTAAALAAHDWLRAQPAIDKDRVVAYGRSLGGGAAAILAAQRRTRALVLESSFTSVRSFAHRFWVPEVAILDPFDNVAAVESYPGPLLILHGNDDKLVPPNHAQALAKASHRAELHMLSCGHNDCDRPWGVIRKFIAANAIVSP